MKRIIRKPTLLILSVILSSFYGSHVLAALPEGMEASLEVKIHPALEEAVEALVTEQKVCEDLWIDWPVRYPKDEKNEVEKKIQALISKKSREKFPLTLTLEFEKEADKEFNLFGIGELVRIELKNRDQVQGYLRKKEKNEILIDNRAIKIEDISERDLVHFNPITREVKRKEFIRGKLSKLQEDRNAYENKILNEISTQMYTDSGYIKIKNEWTPAKEYVLNRLTKERDRLRKTLKPLLKKKIYYENGFVLYEKEWMTIDKAEAKRREKMLALEAQNAGIQTESKPSKEGNEEDGGGLWD